MPDLSAKKLEKVKLNRLADREESVNQQQTKDVESVNSPPQLDIKRSIGPAKQHISITSYQLYD